ncbi:MAG TPA: prepilin peptidase [Gaiellaceae bacterium]|nr:prepilin peptidase [Gaiellaceae bacterium]
MNARREAGAAAVGALVFLAAGLRLDTGSAELARLAVLGSALGAIAAIDLAQHRVPNRIVMPASLACAGLLAAEDVDPERVLGGLGLVALMLGLGLVWPASFGMGDVKLALLLVLGLPGLAAQALLLGLVLAAAFGALLVVRRGRAATHEALPLAPFLSCGAVLAVML